MEKENEFSTLIKENDNSSLILIKFFKNCKQTNIDLSNLLSKFIHLVKKEMPKMQINHIKKLVLNENNFELLNILSNQNKFIFI